VASERAARRARAQRMAVARFLGVTLGVPLALTIGKWPGMPTAPFLTEHVSLVQAAPELRRTLDDVLLVPLGALVVVIARLALGLRVLGPFRSILLAFGFVVTGIATGLVFFAATVAALLVLRPMVRALRLPYFGRVSVMLSVVAMVLVLGAMAGNWLGSEELEGTAHFPIVVLCLIGEAVARCIRKEGVRAGLWRASMTALVAVAVAALASIGPLLDLLARRPELLLVQTALIVLVARHCAWRLLAGRGIGDRVPRPPRVPARTVCTIETERPVAS
jgi:7 transmembrane helices usually fused to an inactive transglutaminase